MTKPSAPLFDNLVRLSETPDIRPPVNDDWQARRELADALRRLNTAALTADVPIEQLRAAADVIRATAVQFERHTRVYGRNALEQLYGDARPDLLYEISPAIGMSNAVAPAMHIWRDGDLVRGRVTPDWSYEGPLQQLHGGVIALLFDQLLGVGQRLAGSGGRTGTLSIRFMHPTPLNVPLDLVAELKRFDGRKKFMSAELWADKTCTASCEGVFIGLKPKTSTPADDSGEPA